MAIRIRPTVDYPFKRLLGDPEHSALTLHFLNAVLGETARITTVDYRNPIVMPPAHDGKLTVLDLLTVDERRRQLNIEMQTSVRGGLSQRLLYYGACLYMRQLRQGEAYRMLQPAINICVLNKILFRESPRAHQAFAMRDCRSGIELSDHLRVHTLELPKCQVQAHNLKQASALDQWMYFLGNAHYMTVGEVADLFGDAIFVRAAEVLEMISRDPLEQALYEARERFDRDEELQIRLSRQEGEERGRREGLLEGRAEGRVEGREEGREQGLLLGQIQVFESLLELPSTPLDELSRRSLVELQARLGELRAAMAKKMS